MLKLFAQIILVKEKDVTFACSGTLMKLYFPLNTSTKKHPLCSTVHFHISVSEVVKIHEAALYISTTMERYTLFCFVSVSVTWAC
jgi:hypothetical protein